MQHLAAAVHRGAGRGGPAANSALKRRLSAAAAPLIAPGGQHIAVTKSGERRGPLTPTATAAAAAAAAADKKRHRRDLSISSVAAAYRGDETSNEGSLAETFVVNGGGRPAAASAAADAVDLRPRPPPPRTAAVAGRRRGRGARFGARAAAPRDVPVRTSRRRALWQRQVVRGIPSLDVAQQMPLSYREMDNTTLLTLAALNQREAREEKLKRHIMSRDLVDYTTATGTFNRIAEFNREGMFAHTLPYKFGIGAAVTAAFASIPLCFHLPSVEYFNEHYVTADVPEPKDLETWLEVGSWAWNWMEPPLGQVSFMLLCMQFARAKLQNIGIKPFGDAVKDFRAARLVKRYPQYDAKVLTEYSKSISYYSR